MSTVEIPESPERFAREFLPELARGLAPSLGAATSLGSFTLRVPDLGEWSLRLRDGALEVTPGMEDDVLLQLTVGAPDFVPLVVEPLRRAPLGVAAGRVAPGLGVLGARPDTARLIRHVPGSVLVRVADGGAPRRLLVTPGRRDARFEDAACTIDCSLSDLEEARAAGLSPMQLFAQGKLRISGNVQIALALSAVLT